MERIDSERRRTAHVSNINGIDGNTVRRLNTAPERREWDFPEQSPKKRPQRQPASMVGIDGVSFLFLMCMLCVVSVLAFSYVHKQNNVRSMRKEVLALRTEVEKQQEKNSIEYDKILASVDLADIYEYATEKLHMVMADGNKVYKYKNKKGDMVKQYSDIPQSENYTTR